jgi:hypothetical protein
MRNAHKILVRKLEGKRTRRRPESRWENNIRMDLRKIRWECVDWIHLAQDKDKWCALVDMVLNLLVP